jgi:anti-anti-sigma factor
VENTAPSLLNVRTVETDSSVRVVVAGEIDLSNADDLGRTLSAVLASASGRPVLVDVARVGFCAAVGVRVLVGAVHRAVAAGAALHLQPRSAAVDIALEICGRLAEVEASTRGPSPVTRIAR